MKHQDRRCCSVVIPTFNRPGALVDTVASIFGSDLVNGMDFELIVVDDGSSQPASLALSDLELPPRWSVRLIRQENRGVGGARNRGYQAATGEVVIFIDDDMVLLPETLRRHIEAHEARPGTVIFGRSPYVAQANDDPFVRWVENLGNDPAQFGNEGLAPARIVASGHLSVERTGQLSEWPEIYAHDMRTPVAEEYELSYRLASSGIPVCIARDAVAFHNRTIDVDSFMRQQFGHGRGCAEAAHRHPECLELDELRRIIGHHQGRSLRRVMWAVLGTAPVRWVLRHGGRAGQRGWLGPAAPLAFRLSSGAWFSAGLRSR